MEFVCLAIPEAGELCRTKQELIDEVFAHTAARTVERRGLPRSLPGGPIRMEAPCLASIVTSLFEAAYKNEEEPPGVDEALESAASRTNPQFSE